MGSLLSTCTFICWTSMPGSRWHQWCSPRGGRTWETWFL